VPRARASSFGVAGPGLPPQPSRILPETGRSTAGQPAAATNSSLRPPARPLNHPSRVAHRGRKRRRHPDQAAGQERPGDYQRCAGGGRYLFALIGLTVGSSHLLSVTRQRVREMEMEVPPNELEVRASQSRGGRRYGRLAERDPDPGGQRFLTLRPRGSRLPVDVRLADVTLVRLLQLGRAGRLHIGTDGPELESAEIQRVLLFGAQFAKA